MKKSLNVLLIMLLTLTIFAGCASNTGSRAPSPSNLQDAAKPTKIVIGASITPHAEILAVVKEILAEEGYELEIKKFTDYIQPNLTLDTGDLDANYFQHQPYLDDFNAENKTDLVPIVAVHYEPFGIYGGKTASIEELKDGAQIAVPNDPTNEARALLLLEAQGLIKLKEGSDLKATVNDIVENPKKLDIIEIEAAQLPRSIQDVDLSVINGNYAIQAGLNASTDALATEDKDSLAAATFANIVAVRKGDENREDLKALVKAITSDKVKSFIEEKYQGAVVPVF